MPDPPVVFPHRSGRQKLIKGLAVFLLLAVGLILVYLTPLKDILDQARDLSIKLQNAGPSAPLIYTLAVTLLVAAGCPRLWLCPLGGLAFGFWEGLLWTQTGSLAGSYLAFLFFRWAGRDWAITTRPRFSRLAQMIERGGIGSVIIIRQLPLPGLSSNIILALAGVGQGAFLLGSAVGHLPAAIPATLAGSGLAQASLTQSLAYILAAAVIFTGLALTVRNFLKKSRGPLAQELRQTWEE